MKMSIKNSPCDVLFILTKNFYKEKSPTLVSFVPALFLEKHELQGAVKECLYFWFRKALPKMVLYYLHCNLI